MMQYQSPPPGCILAIPEWAEKTAPHAETIPFVLWPICGKSLLEHWLDWIWTRFEGSIVVSTKLFEQELLAFFAARPHYAVRVEVMHTDQCAALGDLPRFSFKELPYTENLSEPSMQQDLIKFWFALHDKVLADRNSSDFNLEMEIKPGVWVGINTIISPKTVLHPPCWIGMGTIIEDDCELGPSAYIAENCFIEANVSGGNCLVTRSTFLGSHLNISGKIISGSLIVETATGIRTQVSEIFIAHSIGDHNILAPFFRFMLIGGLFLVTAPIALLWNLAALPSMLLWPKRGTWGYKRLPKGPPLFRDVFALPLIAAGKMRFLGKRPLEQVLENPLPLEGEDVPALFPFTGRSHSSRISRFLCVCAHLLGIRRTCHPL